jgi:rhamnosyltransferase subunit B
MSTGKRIIINTFGSFGDLHPYLSLATELQTRGHNPVLATMEYYREKIEAAGFEFVPIRPNIAQPKAQDQELIERIMEPKTGARFLTEEIVFPAVRDAYEDLTTAVRGADLLITHPATPAGPLVARMTGMKWISTVLAPLSFFSAYDPPVPPFWGWTRHFRLLGPGFMKWFLGKMKSAYKAQLVADFRDELGLSDTGNPMFEGQHSPDLALAMFSNVFAQPQPDWPPQTRVTGFCFYDGRHETPTPPELIDFLDSGPPPIVFTLGSSAVWVAKDFFQESIRAAQLLGQRAVLLIGDERNQLPPLPEKIIALDYAPYQFLLPRAAAVVHHGGVGTTSQGLLAGVPALIVPFAFDQADNAEHARRLGTSRTLPRSKYVVARVAKELNELISNPSYSASAQEVRALLKAENGPATAADLIEEQLGVIRENKEELTYASGD